MYNLKHNLYDYLLRQATYNMYLSCKLRSSSTTFFPSPTPIPLQNIQHACLKHTGHLKTHICYKQTIPVINPRL